MGSEEYVDNIQWVMPDEEGQNIQWCHTNLVITFSGLGGIWPKIFSGLRGIWSKYSVGADKYEFNVQWSQESMVKI